MEKNPLVEKMQNLLEKLLTERGTDGGLECQLSLANGATVAGAVTKTEYDGIYRMVAIMQKQGATGRAGMVSTDLFVPIELVVLITVPTAEKDLPRIVSPHAATGGRIIG